MTAAALGAVAVRDCTQKQHAIRRNFPVIGHLRYQLERFGPELRQYIVTSNDEERPFSRDQRRWVDGLRPAHPFSSRFVEPRHTRSRACARQGAPPASAPSERAEMLTREKPLALIMPIRLTTRPNSVCVSERSTMLSSPPSACR